MMENFCYFNEMTTKTNRQVIYHNNLTYWVTKNFIDFLKQLDLKDKKSVLGHF